MENNIREIVDWIKSGLEIRGDTQGISRIEVIKGGGGRDRTIMIRGLNGVIGHQPTDNQQKQQRVRGDQGGMRGVG